MLGSTLIKTYRLIAFLIAFLLLSVFSLTSAHAHRFKMDHSMIPGRSDGSFIIGMSRNDILAPEPSKTFHFSCNMIKHGKSTRVNIVEDQWNTKMFDDASQFLDILYVDGKIIQVDEESDFPTLKNGIRPGSKISEILRHYKNLRLTTYIYNSRDANGQFGGPFGRYFYDDVRQGVAFYIDMQDTLEDTQATKINGIIIHGAGFPAIPPSNGAKLSLTKPARTLTLPFLYSHLR